MLVRRLNQIIILIIKLGVFFSFNSQSENNQKSVIQDCILSSLPSKDYMKSDPFLTEFSFNLTEVVEGGILSYGIVVINKKENSKTMREAELKAGMYARTNVLEFMSKSQDSASSSAEKEQGIVRDEFSISGSISGSLIKSSCIMDFYEKRLYIMSLFTPSEGIEMKDLPKL